VQPYFLDSVVVLLGYLLDLDLAVLLLDFLLVVLLDCLLDYLLDSLGCSESVVLIVEGFLDLKVVR